MFQSFEPSAGDGICVVMFLHSRRRTCSRRIDEGKMESCRRHRRRKLVYFFLSVDLEGSTPLILRKIPTNHVEANLASTHFSSRSRRTFLYCTHPHCGYMCHRRSRLRWFVQVLRSKKVQSVQNILHRARMHYHRARAEKWHGWTALRDTQDLPRNTHLGRPSSPPRR